METPETLKGRPSAEEYSDLEAQLEELERELTGEVERLGQKNAELTQQITQLQEQSREQMGAMRRQQGQWEEVNRLKYEVEVRLKQESALNQ